MVFREFYEATRNLGSQPPPRDQPRRSLSSPRMHASVYRQCRPGRVGREASVGILAGPVPGRRRCHRRCVQSSDGVLALCKYGILPLTGWPRPRILWGHASLCPSPSLRESGPDYGHKALPALLRPARRLRPAGRRRSHGSGLAPRSPPSQAAHRLERPRASPHGRAVGLSAGSTAVTRAPAHRTVCSSPVAVA